MDCATQDPVAFDSRMCYRIPLVAGAIWEMSVAMFQGLQETSALNVLAGLGVVGLPLGSA